MSKAKKFGIEDYHIIKINIITYSIIILILNYLVIIIINKINLLYNIYYFTNRYNNKNIKKYLIIINY